MEFAPEGVGYSNSLQVAPKPSTAPDLDVTGDNLAWQDKAACKSSDPEVFFPTRGASTKKAKAICAACFVAKECLEYAVGNPELDAGIWGGTAYRERQRIRKERKEKKHQEKEERKAS